MILQDRIFLVTGAGSGLGIGIAEALLEQGASVALCDLQADPVRQTAARLDPEGSRSLAVAADVGDAEAVRRFVAAAAERFGQVDGLVNNAGVIAMGPALEADRAAFDAQFAVNVAGLFLCCQALARHLIGAGRPGRIVNIASNAGKVGFPNMAAYNASKAAVISLTRALAAEWAPQRINVNAVCPGSVLTPMLAGVADFLSPRQRVPAEALLARMVPAQLGRHIRPVEVGRVVAFLLSDAAEIIRGQSINVDGGETPY